MKEGRQLAGYSQAKLAEVLAISRQTVSDYEHGKTSPDEATMVKIADALNVSVDYLLGRSDDLGAVIAPQSDLTREEQQLLRDFRALSRHSRELILGMVHSAAEKEQRA